MLYEHQRQAVEKLKNGSVLCGGVGTGKSRTALAYFYTKVCKGKLPKHSSGYFEPMKNPIPLFIITTARKRDTLEWEKELAPFLMASEDTSPVPVKIDSWNNIGKYVDISCAFFIFDEQRLVGSGAWVKAFYKIAAKNQWILLTATPGDTWLDYCPIFVANGFYRNRTEFIKRHVVYSRFAKFPKVEKYIDTKRLEYFRNLVVIPMEYKKEAVQHHEWVKCGYSVETYDNTVSNRWDYVRNRPFKNKGEMCYAMRRVLNSDRRRFEAVLDILKKHPRVILFYNFDYELDSLRSWISDEGITFSEWNGHRKEPIPDGKSWIYLVQYTSGSEGWNCVETDTVIFYSQNYSYRTTLQAAGRIDRLNTPFTDLYYYHLFSDGSIDRGIRACLKKKKSFNEKTWADSLELTSFA